MGTTDFDINIIYNFLKTIIMETFYFVVAVILPLAGFILFILPRFLKSEKKMN